jgi:hypothetical protein
VKKTLTLLRMGSPEAEDQRGLYIVLHVGQLSRAQLFNLELNQMELSYVADLHQPPIGCGYGSALKLKKSDLDPAPLSYVAEICINMKRIWIRLLNLMRIRFRLFTLMRDHDPPFSFDAVKRNSSLVGINSSGLFTLVQIRI